MDRQDAYCESCFDEGNEAIRLCPLHAQAEAMRAFLLEIAHQLPDPPPPGTYWTGWEGPHEVCLSVADTTRLRGILRATEGRQTP